MAQFKRKRTPSTTTSTFDLSTHVAQVNYYKLVTSGVFEEGRRYYTKAGDVYTLVESTEYTLDDPIPADTYYVVDSHDPHPQYLLRKDYAGTSEGAAANPEIVVHNDDPASHNGIVGEFSTFKDSTNSRFTAANLHLAQATTENQSKHKDMHGQELYSFRTHKHELNEIGLAGAASATHDHDSAYAVINHHHDGRYATSSHLHQGYLNSDQLTSSGIYPEAAHNPGNDNPDYNEVDTFNSIVIMYPDAEVENNTYVFVKDESVWYKSTVTETENPEDLDNPIITVEWNETTSPDIPVYLRVDIDTIVTQSFVLAKDLINAPFQDYGLVKTYVSPISENVEVNGVVVLYGIDNLYQTITNNKQTYHRAGSTYTIKNVTGDATSYMNDNGSGDRSETIEITYTGVALDLNDNMPTALIDGNIGPPEESETRPTFMVQFPVADESFVFDLKNPRYLTEIKCWIEGAINTSIGEWQVVGSNDYGATWSEPLCLPTELKGSGTTFPLTSPTIFSLTSDVAYQHYKLEGVGSANTQVGVLWEFEFKIDAGIGVFQSSYLKMNSWEPWISNTSNIVSKEAIKPISAGQTIFNITPECGMDNTLFIEISDNSNVLHDVEIVRSETEFTVTLAEPLPLEVLNVTYVYHTPVATVSDVETHTSNSVRHITTEERSAWNADGPAIAALANIVDGIETEITGMSTAIDDINDLLGI